MDTAQDDTQKKMVAEDLDQLTHNPTPTLAEEITAEFGGKEREPKMIVEEIPAHPEVEKHPELSGYLERVEKEAELKTPVMDDQTQQVVMQAANPQTPKITLPLTDDQIQQGLHHKVWESIRWLAEWCLRQLKLV